MILWASLICWEVNLAPERNLMNSSWWLNWCSLWLTPAGCQAQHLIFFSDWFSEGLVCWNTGTGGVRHALLLIGLTLQWKKKIETWNEREIERVKGRKKEVHKRDERICPGELLCHPWDTINNCRHSLSPWKQAAMLDRRDTLCWNDRDIQY